jgi:2-amino-4-hydroxy-6-hydroxymethyldihydropteridine diphosphokinase
MNPRTFIAVGSSAADALNQAGRAVKQLGRGGGVSVTAVSPWFETAPVGSAGSRFINGVVEISTSLQPLVLLETLQAIEHELGRVPGDRWGARAIDLDLLACGDSVIEDGRLQLPHPALWYRRFVLDPWERIAADWAVPRWDMSVADLRQRLLQRPLPVRLAGGDCETRQAIADETNDRFDGVVTITSEAHSDGSSAFAADASGPVHMSLGYITGAAHGEARWNVNLSQLASTLQTNMPTVAGFILTAALDEPHEIRD